MSSQNELKMQKNKIMTVTMEDGVVVTFFYQNGQPWFTMFNGAAFFSNQFEEASLHAVVGKPLLLSYYCEYGAVEKVKTETKVKSIEYMDE